ncbi:hypothetical protein JCM8547_008097 [Rhodosporidiobolus lusitaniae]
MNGFGLLNRTTNTSATPSAPPHLRRLLHHRLPLLLHPLHPLLPNPQRDQPNLCVVAPSATKESIKQPREKQPQPPQHKPFRNVEPKMQEERVYSQDDEDWFKLRARKKRFLEDSEHGASPPRAAKKTRTQSSSEERGPCWAPQPAREASQLSTSPIKPSTGILPPSTPRNLQHPYLTLGSYSPYLTNLSIEIPWSSAYYNTLNAPNKLAIQSTVGRLGSSQGYKGLPDYLHLRIGAFRDVMRWVWDDWKKDILLEQASWLIEQANRDRRLLPIYILLRGHASTLRFSDSMDKAQHELSTDLVSSPIQGVDTPFFCKPDEAVRPKSPEGKGSWEWWMREPRVGEVHSKAELDEWERGVMRVEEWRNQ